MKWWKFLRQKFSQHPFFWLAVLTSLVVTAVLLPFLLRSGYLVFGDVTEGILSQNIVRRYFWTFDDNIGPALVEKARLPLFTLFWGLFTLLRMPDEALLKVKILTLFVLSVWSFIAAIALTRKHFQGEDASMPSRQFLVATFLGTLVFLFNPWMMNRLNHFFLYFGSVNLPLVFALYLDFLLDHSSARLNLLKLLAIVAITSATPHIVVIEVLVILVMTVVVLLFSPERWRIAKLVAVVGGVGLVIGLLLNAYWLWPYLSSLGDAAASPDKVLTLEVLRLLSQYDQVFNTIRLLGYWWPSTKYFLDWSPPLYFLGIAGSLILPTFFGAYVFFGFKRLAVRVVGAVAVIGLFLCSYTPVSEALYSYLMFSSPLQSLGWVFREIDKIGLVLVFCFSLTFVYLVARLLAHRFYVPVAAAVILLGIFCYPHVAFTLYYDFAPQYVPKAFFLADDLLAADPGNFNVVWYPKVVDPVWSTNSDEPGNFAIYSSSEPALGYSSDTAALINYALDYRNAAKINIAKFLDLLGVKYLVVRSDAKSTTQAPLVATLDGQSDLAKVAQYDFLTIYENRRFSGLFKLKTEQVISTLGLETFKYLDSLNIETSNSAITLTDSVPKAVPSLPVSRVLLENGNTNDLTMSYLGDYFIYPFNYSFRGDISKYWSRATATDQIHGELTPLLNEVSINNHQLDFRGGVVVASDQKFFADEGRLGILAASGTPSLPLIFGQPVTNNPYWEIASSDSITVSAGQTFYLEYDATASNYNCEANLRVLFYNSGKELLRTFYSLPQYSRYSGVFTVPDQTTYMVVQELGRPAYDLKISHVRLLDVTSQTNRLSLSFTAPVGCSGTCGLWLRSLDSSAGGGLRLKVGSTIYDVNTYSSYNRFNWHYLGDVTGTGSNLNFELVNLGGFEAVNALAVVPQDKMAAAQEQTANILAAGQSFIVTNPDTALPIQNGYFGTTTEPATWPISYPTKNPFAVSPTTTSSVIENLVTVTPVASQELSSTLKPDNKGLALVNGLFKFTAATASANATDTWLVASSGPVAITGGHDYLISGSFSGTALKQFHLKVGTQEIFDAIDGDVTNYSFSRVTKISDWSHNVTLSFLVRGDATGASFKVSKLTIEDMGASSIAPEVLAEMKPEVRVVGGVGGAALNGGIEVVKNNPTNYSVTLAQSSTSALLSFAKPFSTDWLLNGQKPQLVDAIFNGWGITASSSGLVVVTYGPQAYFVWGSVVSGVTALLVALLYFILHRRSSPSSF